MYGLVMRVKTTVTEKKLAANRENAKRSTGPRTQRGKDISRFNAVTSGLFAEHVVIPACDGDRYEDDDVVEQQYSTLLMALQQEHQPEGPSEQFWVELMAECMWKQRRVSRSEKNLVQAKTEINSSDGPIALDRLCYGITILEKAVKEVEVTRVLSPATYDDVVPFLDLVRTGVLKMPRVKSKNDSVPDEVKIDAEFITSLETTKTKIEQAFLALMEKKSRDEYRAAHAFPAEGDMEQILRYDRALQKNSIGHCRDFLNRKPDDKGPCLQRTSKFQTIPRVLQASNNIFQGAPTKAS
jgi:hypothetical protein